jgi:hypothetical protein
MENKSKLNTVLLVIIIILLIVILGYFFLGDSRKKENTDLVNNLSQEEGQTLDTNISNNVSSSKNTYTYSNHGFNLELPKGYVPKEDKAGAAPALIISLPVGSLSYITDASFWEKYNIPSYTYIKDQKIGETTFKVYTYSGATFYWFKKGNVGYEFGGTDTIGLENLIKTFKFVGWAQN